jgi:hypothetical protein
MAQSNCFNTATKNSFGSDYIAKKKAVAIFKGAANVASHNGLLKKSNGTSYRGDIYTNSCKKLVGASSYDQLRNVTFGKYIADPLNFSVNDADELWTGNLTYMDLSGLIAIDASFGGMANTFIPNDASNIIYVDPCYNMFYDGSTNDEDIRGLCYLNKQLSYRNRVTIITDTSGLPLSYKAGFNNLKERYVRTSNELVGNIYYPASNLKLECQDLWKT